MTQGDNFTGCSCPELDSYEVHDAMTALGTPSSSASVPCPTSDYDQPPAGTAVMASDTANPIPNLDDPISYPPVLPCKCCECGAEVVRGKCIECGHRMCPDCCRSSRANTSVTTSTPFPTSPTSQPPTTHPPLILYDCCKCSHLMRSSEAGVGCRKCGHFRCRACTRVDYEGVDEVYEPPCVPCRCCRCTRGLVGAGGPNCWKSVH